MTVERGPTNVKEEVAASGRELLSVRLGDARFGIWVDEVLEILRTPPISLLPLPLRELAGVTSVRGEVIPVLDLGIRLLDTPARRPGRLVLIQHHESDAVLGLLVDAVDTLLSVVEEEIRPAPGAAEAALPPEMMTGVVVHDSGVVTVLHLGRAAAPPEADSKED